MKEIDESIQDVLDYFEYSDAPMENNLFDIEKKLVSMRTAVEKLNKANVDRAEKAEKAYQDLVDSF